MDVTQIVSGAAEQAQKHEKTRKQVDKQPKKAEVKKAKEKNKKSSPTEQVMEKISSNWTTEPIQNNLVDMYFLSFKVLQNWSIPMFRFAEFMRDKAEGQYVRIKIREFPISSSYIANLEDYFVNTAGCLEIKKEKNDRGKPSSKYKWSSEKLLNYLSTGKIKV